MFGASRLWDDHPRGGSVGFRMGALLLVAAQLLSLLGEIVANSQGVDGRKDITQGVSLFDASNLDEHQKAEWGGGQCLLDSTMRSLENQLNTERVVLAECRGSRYQSSDYSPRLPFFGCYEMAVCHPGRSLGCRSNLRDSAAVHVTYEDGVEEVYLQTSDHSGKWKVLGNYDMNPARVHLMFNDQCHLHNGCDSETTELSAIRFRYVGPYCPTSSGNNKSESKKGVGTKGHSLILLLYTVLSILFWGLIWLGVALCRKLRRQMVIRAPNNRTSNGGQQPPPRAQKPLTMLPVLVEDPSGNVQFGAPCCEMIVEPHQSATRGNGTQDVQDVPTCTV